jgi:hypothetical protein
MAETQLDFNKIIQASGNLSSEKSGFRHNIFPTLIAGAKTAENFKPSHGYWAKMANRFIEDFNISKENFLNHPKTLEKKRVLDEENSKNWDSFRKAVHHELTKKQKPEVVRVSSQLDMFEEGRVKPQKTLKIDRAKFVKKLSLTGLYLATEGFLAYQSIGFYHHFFGDLVVAVVLSLLVNVLILTFARLGRFLDSGFVWVLVGLNILTFLYASIVKDKVYLENEKKIEKINEDIVFNEKNLKKTREQKLILESDFLNQYKKNYKTNALTITQKGIETKASSIKGLERKIESLQKKKIGIRNQWYILSFGTYIFIIFKLILQFSSLRIAYVTKKLKWGLKFKKGVV